MNEPRMMTDAQVAELAAQFRGYAEFNGFRPGFRWLADHMGALLEAAVAGDIDNMSGEDVGVVIDLLAEVVESCRLVNSLC